MNTLMMVLQQPLSVAMLAQCLGLRAGDAQLARRRRTGRRRAARRQQAPTPLVASLGPTTDTTAEANSPAEACGWFDSSHELHQGLLVLEHSGAEGLGRELPVTVWLELVLGAAADADTAVTLAPAQGIIAA